MNQVCKLCSNEAPLIKAHIIPRSFWEIDAAHPPRIVTNINGDFPKRIPIGVYDQTIVCERCERSFSKYDTYAAELFLNRAKEFEEVRDNSGKLTGYLHHNFDYSRLKLFTIAVLWRASASSHPFFSRVRLGPFERNARDMLLRRDPGEAATFAVLFSIWDSPVMMDPFAGSLCGVRVYRFYLGRLVAYINVDRRPFPTPLMNAVLMPDSPLHLISRDLGASKDFRVAAHVMAANQLAIQRYFGRLS
jgi:hypothetical protein